MKKVNSIQEFIEYTLRKNEFKCTKDEGNCRTFINKNGEEFIEYSRLNQYYLGIANYSVAKDFRVSFTNPAQIFKFGIVFKGITSFKINDVESHFSPSAFFTLENNISGIQTFHKDNHHQGIEITIYKEYLDELCRTFHYPNIEDFNLKPNTTYPYLPEEIVMKLQQLLSLHNKNMLTPLRLEAGILECVDIFFKEFMNQKGQMDTSAFHTTTIMIGNRSVKVVMK